MPGRTVIAVASLAVLLACAGCASERSALPDQSLYQRLGGSAAITAVVEDAVGNIAADPRLNGRFASAGNSHLTRNLAALVCIRTGGPCTYAGRDMSAAHEGMNIRDDEFDALVEDVVKSLDKFKVPPREKGELRAILVQMRNAVVGH
jgi:hemoglobin